MKSIRDWNDLREFGINALTGEADRTGQRILCDLTDYGQDIVCDLLGIGRQGIKQGWNDPLCGSMMIPRSLFVDLAVWCLLVGTKCPEAFHATDKNESGSLRSTSAVSGLFDCTREEWEEHIALLESLGFRVHRVRVGNHPGEGTRCTHQMSGRTT